MSSLQPDANMLSDEELALMLQAQFDQENQSANQAADQDALLALQLQNEWNEPLAGSNFSQSNPNPVTVIPPSYQPPSPPSPYQQSSPYLSADYDTEPFSISNNKSKTNFALTHFEKEVLQKPSTSPDPSAIRRIRKDLQDFLSQNDPALFVSPDEEDITVVQGLIVGPDDTPYQGGFFHLTLRFPADYPWSPPKAVLRTTDHGRTRFNPNLYAEGKICLSILGTWPGPKWTPIQTLSSVMRSIQSLMNPLPYHNEPGYESEHRHGDALKYNDCIQHETIRVAVCGMLEEPTCDQLFREEIVKIFLANYDKYVKICEEQRAKHPDGTSMSDPFGEERGSYNYSSLIERLVALRSSLTQH